MHSTSAAVIIHSHNITAMSSHTREIKSAGDSTGTAERAHLLTTFVLAALAPLAWAASDAQDDGVPASGAASIATPVVPAGVPGNIPGVTPPTPATSTPARQPRPRVVPPPTPGSSPTAVPVPGVPPPPGTPVAPAALPVPGVPVAPGVQPGQQPPTAPSVATITPRPRVVPVPPGVPTQNLTLKIDKQLMGKVDVATLKTTRSGEFTPGQRYVVGLVKTDTGWAVSQSAPWFEGKDEAQVAEAIKEFPLHATLVPPAPELPIDTDMEWKVKVKNTGKKDLSVSFQSLSLICTTPGLTSYGLPPPVPGSGRSSGSSFSGDFATIKAGEEGILTRTERLYGPSNWKFFGPQAWPLDYKARAILRFSEVVPPPLPGAPPSSTMNSFSAQTDWLVGKAVAPPAK